MSNDSSASVWGWLRADLRRFDLALAVLASTVSTALVFINPGGFDFGWPEVAAGVAMFVLLVFRRRASLVFLGVALAWTAVHIAVFERPTPMVFAILVLLAMVCVRLERRAAIGLGVGIGLSIYLIGLVVNSAELGDERAIIGIAWAAVAVGIGDASRTWRRYSESSKAELRSAVLAAEAQARAQVSEERLTIARELHDLLAHNLSVMNVQTGAALHLLRSNPEVAEQSLIEARDAGKSVLDELGGLLAVLRHDGDGAPTQSLPSVDELDELVERMRAAGLPIEWTYRGSPGELAPVASLAAYRIVQEGLTNAAKHGRGPAELVTSWEDGGLALTIQNEVGSRNEVGSSTAVGSGQGVVGMAERATVNGGRFDAREVDGRFIIEAWLPANAHPEVVT